MTDKTRRANANTARDENKTKTPAERVAEYDCISFAAVLESHYKNERGDIRMIRAYIDAIENAPKVGGIAAFVGLSSLDRYHLGAAIIEMDRLVDRLRRAHTENRDRVEAEDAAVEQARLASIAAQEKAVADKEARLAKLRELRALESEFPEE